MEKHSGSCLCGAVRFRTSGALRGVIYCHCTQCRKQTGHYVAATQAADQNIAIEGAENLTWYAASPGARRGFCKECGSSLFWERLKSGAIGIAAGTLDAPTKLKTIRHIFVDHRGDYYRIADRLRKSPGSMS